MCTPYKYYLAKIGSASAAVYSGAEAAITAYISLSFFSEHVSAVYKSCFHNIRYLICIHNTIDQAVT